MACLSFVTSVQYLIESSVNQAKIQNVPELSLPFCLSGIHLRVADIGPVDDLEVFTDENARRTL
jgi:hypothetical protein